MIRASEKPFELVRMSAYCYAVHAVEYLANSRHMRAEIFMHNGRKAKANCTRLADELNAAVEAACQRH